VRVATLLFYAIATQCLGSIALEMGGPRLLAGVTGSGFELDSRWQVAWAVGTVFFSALFFLWAALYVGRRDKDE
jgi:hypothetical protein